MKKKKRDFQIDPRGPGCSKLPAAQNLHGGTSPVFSNVRKTK